MAGRLMHRVDPSTFTPIFDGLLNRPVQRITDQIRGIQGAQNHKKYSTYNSTGVPSTFLQSGPQSINFIVNGDISQITRAWFLFNITVSNAPVTLLPAFMWPDRIHSYKDSTNARGQESLWVSNLISYGNLTPAQFDVMARAMLVKAEDAWTVEPLQPATYNVYVPLFGTTLFTDANIKIYPQRMNITIDSPSGGCVEAGLATNVVLNSAGLVLEELMIRHDMEEEIVNSVTRAPVQRTFLDWLSLAPQNVTINAGVATQISVTLAGLEGATPFLVFGLRAQADQTAVGGASKRFVKIGTNTSGTSIALLSPSYAQIWNQPIDPYLQQIVASEYSYGSILDQQWSGLYIIDYTKDRIGSYNGAIGEGFRKAQNNEILQITFGRNVPEVARVIQLTTVDASGTVVAATGGKFQLQYTNGYGSVYVSDFINYNDPQATVQAALDKMGIIGGSKLVAGATNVNVVAGLTVTMSNLNDFDTATLGARWAVVTSSFRTSAGFLAPSLTDSGGTSVVGVTPGNYTLYVWFPKFAFLTIYADRTTSVRDLMV